MSDSKEQLKQVFQLIKGGQNQQALQILMPIVKAEKNNSTAWFLMAKALDDPKQKVKALEKVLSLRPDHIKAQEMLAQYQGAPITAPPAKPAPPPAPSVEEEEDPFDAGDAAAFDDLDDPFGEPAPTSKRRRKAAQQDDDIFAGFNDDEGDDPFADVGKKPKPRKAKPPTPPVHTKKSSSSGINWVVAIGAYFAGIATCAFAACAIFYMGAFSFANLMQDEWNVDWNDAEYSESGESFASDVVEMGGVESHRPVRGTLPDGFTEHGYTFSGNTGQVMELELNARDGSLDPVLTVYGPDGTVMAENDDREFMENRNSYLLFTLPASGTYRVVAGGFAGGGDYELILRLQ